MKSPWEQTSALSGHVSRVTILLIFYCVQLCRTTKEREQLKRDQLWIYQDIVCEKISLTFSRVRTSLVFMKAYSKHKSLSDKYLQWTRQEDFPQAALYGGQIFSFPPALLYMEGHAGLIPQKRLLYVISSFSQRCEKHTAAYRSSMSQASPLNCH